MPPNLMPPWLRYAIVLTGLALIVFEAVSHEGEPRWSLLVVYTGMIGITSLLGLDRRGGSNQTEVPPPPGPPISAPPSSPPGDPMPPPPEGATP